MRVEVSELRKAFELLIDHLESSDCRNLEIAEDSYWDIPQTVRYDLTAEPGKIAAERTLGLLSDDWGEVQSMVRGDSDTIGYGLVWLASVIRRIGEQNVG